MNNLIEYEILTNKSFKKYLPQIVELFHIQFTIPTSSKDFIWRYLKSPSNDLNVIIAKDKNKVVGFVGTMANKITNKKNIINAAMFTNTMVHPNYCKQGIFQQMVKKLEKELIRKQYDFIYVFPNSMSNHIYIEKLGWKAIYEIPRLEYKKNEIQVGQKDYEVRKDNKFLLNYTNINKKSSKLKIIHDIDFFKWRIVNNTQYKYDNYVINKKDYIESYIIVRIYEKEYNIVDYSFLNEKHAEKLLNKVIKEFKEKNLDILTVWCNINEKNHLLYEKFGFVNRQPITYFIGKAISKKIGNFYNWENWCIQAIDDNIY